MLYGYNGDSLILLSRISADMSADEKSAAAAKRKKIGGGETKKK